MIPVFSFIAGHTTSRQHAVIKHWGFSGMPSALLAGKVLIV